MPELVLYGIRLFSEQSSTSMWTSLSQIAQQNISSHWTISSGLIVAISTFTGGSRTSGPTGGDYFIGFITILIAAGWVIAALGDFFILTKVRTSGDSLRLTGSQLTHNYSVTSRSTATTEPPVPASPRPRRSSRPTCSATRPWGTPRPTLPCPGSEQAFRSVLEVRAELEANCDYFQGQQDQQAPRYWIVDWIKKKVSLSKTYQMEVIYSKCKSDTADCMYCSYKVLDFSHSRADFPLYFEKRGNYHHYYYYYHILIIRD